MHGQRLAHKIQFQGEVKELPLLRVDLNLPKYRLANIRTKALQLEYLADNPKLKKDFFKVDPESDKVQAVQHELLLKLVDEKKLLSYFKKRKQEQPIILDENGYVVNGNRRLCAWRTLNKDNPQKYSYFKKIEVVVLPRCTEEDILDLEAYLQIHEDIRAEYSWTAKAIAFRELRENEELKLSDKKIATIYQIKINEIKEMIDALDYAEEFLNEIGEPNKYEKVIKDNYAFMEIVKGRKKLNNNIEKELFKELSFLYISKPEGLGRSYGAVKNIKKFLPALTKNIRSEFNLPEGESGVQKLTKILKKDNDRDEIHSLLCETIEDEKNRHKVKKSKDLTIIEVKKAATSLVNAINGYKKESNIKGIKEHINSIEKSLKQIKRWSN